MRFLALAALLAATPATAQQQQMSPSQMALTLNQAIGNLALFAEQEKQRADALQAQVAELRKQLTEAQKLSPPASAK